MAHCSSCEKFVRDSDIFCLTCGSLLADYENVKLDCLNYNLKGDEFLNQVAEQFSNSSSRYSEVMNDFSSSLYEYTDKINAISQEHQFAIYKEHVERMKTVFDGLTGLFDSILSDLSDVVHDLLILSNLIWKHGDDELKDSLETPYQNRIVSLQNLVNSTNESKNSFNSITIAYPNEDFDIAKANLLLRFDRFIIFNESYIRELKFIKDKHLNNNSMVTGDSHNHFCIYCGARIDDGQNFCSECGKQIYRDEEPVKVVVPSEYDSKITELEHEYNIKQKKALELVEKLFDPDHFAYDKFTTSITKSNNLFSIQIDIARKMAEMDVSENPFVIKELDTKIETLETFIDKMEDLTSELIIHMSSNKKDNDDIHNLFNDMDDLIDSVKDY